MAPTKNSKKGSEQKHAFQICNWTEEDGEKRWYRERKKEKDRKGEKERMVIHGQI